MTASDLKSQQSEALRKVGRNVLYFQRMEAMLKFLVSRSELEGDSPEELKEHHGQRVEAISRNTMGTLVNSLFSSVFTSSDAAEDVTRKLSEKRFSISISLKSTPESIEQQRAALERIVEERNQLIHQMLSIFDHTSIESCQQLGSVLDAQLDQLRPQYENLLQLVDALRDGVHQLAKNGVKIKRE